MYVCVSFSFELMNCSNTFYFNFLFMSSSLYQFDIVNIAMSTMLIRYMEFASLSFFPMYTSSTLQCWWCWYDIEFTSSASLLFLPCPHRIHVHRNVVHHIHIMSILCTAYLVYIVHIVNIAMSTMLIWHRVYIVYIIIISSMSTSSTLQCCTIFNQDQINRIRGIQSRHDVD